MRHGCQATADHGAAPPRADPTCLPRARLLAMCLLHFLFLSLDMHAARAVICSTVIRMLLPTIDHCALATFGRLQVCFASFSGGRSLLVSFSPWQALHSAFLNPDFLCTDASPRKMEAAQREAHRRWLEGIDLEKLPREAWPVRFLRVEPVGFCCCTMPFPKAKT